MHHEGVNFCLFLRIFSQLGEYESKKYHRAFETITCTSEKYAACARAFKRLHCTVGGCSSSEFLIFFALKISKKTSRIFLEIQVAKKVQFEILFLRVNSHWSLLFRPWNEWNLGS